ncbi:SDR family oxidoreductase [Curvibacter sp. APW13]|uniref:SDR family oxidoreductase n=1 Tax=Curvibacter sp. APW13 TaxID=3077236 RepID=UPI0028DEFE69|nr:SDR family oxidoreductase [Curvibacter sp. APW13]MDT8992331.1 SDR family oxidoreductase [Curvibacter sp. APW13]
MPANTTPLGALPARFRRQRLLIVGCGDVGQRVARHCSAGVHVLALTTTADSAQALRAQGIQPLRGNLDQPGTLARLAGLGQRVLHLAPPPLQGWTDPRTLALLRALRRRSLPAQLSYVSTSGIYGDCDGAWVPESRLPMPQTPRAHRRVDAEAQLRFWGRSSGVPVQILRAPGIYAADRADGTPVARLQKGTPVLCDADDVYTNHIHADDLARACLRAVWNGRAQRSYNVNDDTVLKMGDYFDLAADLLQLPRPPRVARAGAQAHLSVMVLSFMSESRRLVNTRMKQELRLQLRYPTVQEGLASLRPSAAQTHSATAARATPASNSAV